MENLEKSLRPKPSKKSQKKPKVFKIIKIQKNNKKQKKFTIKNNQNGLVSISKAVFELLKEKKSQTGLEVLSL